MLQTEPLPVAGAVKSGAARAGCAKFTGLGTAGMRAGPSVPFHAPVDLGIPLEHHQVAMHHVVAPDRGGADPGRPVGDGEVDFVPLVVQGIAQGALEATDAAGRSQFLERTKPE